MREYKFDAFISYRGKTRTKVISHRLMHLLQGYKAPKRVACKNVNKITNIFRDSEQLSMSSDLRSDIRRALENSRFLIVIGSPPYQESPWCMEEVRYFKETHGGSTEGILLVLAEGEPDESFFPQIGYYKKDGGDPPDISGIDYVEPLYADVRADTRREAIRKLRSIYLKIAAPILGCEYIELSDWDARRRKLRTISVLSAVFVSIAIFVAYILYSLNLISISDNKARTSLASLYDNFGSAGVGERTDHGKNLAFFAESISTKPENAEFANDSVAFILQQHTFGFANRIEKGAIIDSRVMIAQKDLDADMPHDDTCLVDNSLADGLVYENWKDDAENSANIIAVDDTGELLLTFDYSGGKHYSVRERSGAVIDGFDSEKYYAKTSADGKCWIFGQLKNHSVIYNTVQRRLYSIDIPTDVNPNCEEIGLLPAYIDTSNGGDTLFASYGGYIYRYKMKDGEYEPYKTIDIARIFTQEKEESVFDVFESSERKPSPDARIWTDPKDRLLIIENLYGIAAVNLKDDKVMYEVNQNKYTLSDVKISGNMRYIALAYGGKADDYNYALGGYTAVFNALTGEKVFSTDLIYRESVIETGFNKDDTMIYALSAKGDVRLFEVKTSDAAEWCNVIKMSRPIKSCAFSEGTLCVSTRAGEIIRCAFVCPKPVEYASGEEPGQTFLIMARMDDRLVAFSHYMAYTFDLNGNLIAKDMAKTSEYSRLLGRASAIAPYQPAGFRPLLAAAESDADTTISNRGAISEKEAYDTVFKGLNGMSLVCRRYKEIAIIDEKGKDLFRSRVKNGEDEAIIEQAALSNDKKRLYIVDSDNKFLFAYAVDWENLTITREAAVDVSPDKPMELRIDEGGGRLAVGCNNSSVLIYDTRSLDAPISVLREGEIDEIKEMIFDKSGKYLAASIKIDDSAADEFGFNYGGAVELWNVENGTLSYIDRTGAKESTGALMFYDDYLYYAVNTDIKRLWMPYEIMRPEMLPMVKAVSGYEIVKGNRLKRSETRALSGESFSGLGKWSDLIDIRYAI